MKILILTADYYAQLGGKFTHIMMLKSGLEGLGHSVDVIFPKRTALNALIISGIGRILDPLGLGVYYRQNAIGCILGRALGRYLRKNRPDIVNTEDIIAFSAAKSIKTELPLIITVHGELAQEMESAGHIKRESEKKLFLDTEKRSYEGADYVVSVDTRLRDHVVDLAPLSKGKIEIIQNFIDVESFRRKLNLLDRESVKRGLGIIPSKKVILVPRRLVLKCGVIYAVKAAEILRTKYGRTDLVFLIVGVGPERGNILDCISEKELIESVTLIDGAEYDRMPGFYKISDIVLVPSINVKGYKEATSLSVIEAMAARVPVIASDIGGLSEMIDNGITGILVPERSSEEIAENIVKLLNGKEFADRMTSAAFDYVVKNHSNETAATRFARIYEKEIKKNGRS